MYWWKTYELFFLRNKINNKERKLTECVGAPATSSASESVMASVGERVGANVWTFDICMSSTTISLQKLIKNDTMVPPSDEIGMVLFTKIIPTIMNNLFVHTHWSLLISLI